MGVKLGVQDTEWHLGLSLPSLLVPLPCSPTEDGLLRCKQLTLLLDWAEQFAAESRQSDKAVAFSMLLGDLNFDNCLLGDRRLQRGGPGVLALTTERWPLCRPRTRATAPSFQPLPGSLQAGHTSGAALGPGYRAWGGGRWTLRGLAETPTDTTLPRPPKESC